MNLKLFYCIHSKLDGCPCRKPKPGLLDQSEKYFGKKVDIFIGDNITDYHAAQNYGSEFVLVLTGRGEEFEHILKNKVKIYSNLYDYLSELIS